jgi:hypothetical protein
MSAVNAVGLSEIREFLETHHKRDEPFTLENLRAWARDAEFQMSEGNPPSIEIRAFDSVSGHAEQYTISEDGIDVPASGMSAHTPGPWVLVRYSKGTHLPIPFMEHETVAVFSHGVKRGDVAYMQHGLHGDDQALANARLIAAAPEMLGALYGLLDVADGGGHLTESDCAKARAAIAKATGGAA